MPSFLTKTTKLSAEPDGILGKGRLWDLQGQLAPSGRPRHHISSSQQHYEQENPVNRATAALWNESQ